MKDDLHGREARLTARRRQVRRRRLALGATLFCVMVIGVAAALLLRGDDPGAMSASNGAPAAIPSLAVTAAASDESAAGEPVPQPEAPPLRKPTKKRPLRAYFGGDSLAGMPGIMFARRAESSGLMTVRVDYQVSSRLTVPDPVDWPAHLRSQMTARRYDVAVFLIGINDPGMPMLANGGSTSYPKKAWLAEYQDRVEKMMRIMLQSGVQRVYWAGLPPMPTGAQNGAVKRLNRLFEVAVSKYPEVVYVDTFTPLATKAGAFNPNLRSGDGVHFTNEGATRIATAVWQAMKRDWTPSKTSTPVP